MDDTHVDFMLFESKRRSRVYKGQPDARVIVKNHPLKSGKWTYDFGQAAISMKAFDTKEDALEEAREMMCAGPTIGENWPKE